MKSMIKQFTALFSNSTVKLFLICKFNLIIDIDRIVNGKCKGIKCSLKLEVD